MEVFGILLFFTGFFLGCALVFLLKNKELTSIKENQEDLKTVFGNLSNEALIENQKKFLEIAEDKFSTLMGKSDEQLGRKKELIDSTLKEMKSDLKILSDNTISLKAEMEESRKRVGQLSDTTSKLRMILSSSQARGQWGERLVKDILDFIGLVEGINYSKQSQLPNSTQRPDFTFFLPDNTSLNMDVKFPLTHYENYISSSNESERKSEKKAFLNDVRNRIREVSKRSYINPEGGTVDYVLLFIPNESVYSFLNQEDLSLIDFSLKNKILLCSPITLYAILSLIRQAVSNFSMEKKASEVQELVGVFRKQWDNFILKVDSIGKTLTSLTNHYEDLKGPRLRAVEKPMEKIEDLQLGNFNNKDIEA
tara:strand:- start:940 stop:2037 length:1098 start_codon:yes stop_codon:yes gene_type:complete